VAAHLAHEDAALARRLDDVAALVQHGGFHSGAASFGELRRAHLLGHLAVGPASFQRHLRRLVALLRGHHRRECKLVRAALGQVGTLGAFLARPAEAEAQERRAAFERVRCGSESGRSSWRSS
jgi:hypothetical protein